MRSLDGHKGTFGRVLLAAGSDEMPGAAGLAARSAYRAGAGLVEVATTSGAMQVLQTHLLEAVWTVRDPSTNPERLGDAKALVIGPGLGTSEEATALVTAMLQRVRDDYSKLPVIIDADGLNILAANGDWPSMLPTNAVLTPHPGEMARLTGLPIEEVQKDRLALAIKTSAEWNAILVLKGAHTVVAAPDGRVAISPFKSDALAKGGTGDVLSGMIGAFCAQGLKPYDAAVLSVYAHGLAGVIAAEKTGHAAGVLASEVADAIPAALGRISAG
jgi:NAD(P)H-hydrate epimerase